MKIIDQFIAELSKLIRNQEQPSTLKFAKASSTIQTLILDKSIFETAEDATKWIDEHGFHSSKIDETDDSFRFRQIEPEEFEDDSFRTIELRDGVKAVIGQLKSEKQSRRLPLGEVVKFAKKVDDEGSQWDIVIAEAGPTLNNIFIDPAVLKNNVAMFEGVRLMKYELEPGSPTHLPFRTQEKADALGGLVGNMVGIVKDVYFEDGAGVNGLGELRGRAHVFDQDLKNLLLELEKINELENQIGLSFYVKLPEIGGIVESTDIRKGKFELKVINSVESVDVVLHPAANGRFKALAASRENMQKMQEVLIMDKFKELLAKLNPDVAEMSDLNSAIDKTLLKNINSYDTTLKLMTVKVAVQNQDWDSAISILQSIIDYNAQCVMEEAKNTASMSAESAPVTEPKNDPPVDPPAPAEDPKPAAPAEPPADPPASATDIQKTVEEAVKMAVIREAIKNTVAQSSLTDAGKEHAISVLMSKNNVNENEIANTIREISKLEVIKMENTTTNISVGQSAKDKVKQGLFHLLGVADDASTFKPQRLSQVIAAFGYEEASSGLRMTGATASADLKMEVTTADLPNALSEAMNRRMQKTYNAMPNIWRNFVSEIATLSDFRPRHIVKVDGLEDLTKKVAETDQYTEIVVAPTDNDSVYSPDEYGKKVTLSRKFWKNDDIGVIRKLSDNAARAASRTIDRYVIRLVTGDDPAAPAGPNTRLLPDGNGVLYSLARGNMITDAMSPDAISSLKRLLALQIESGQDGVEMGLMLNTCFYPIELGPTADTIFGSEKKAGTPNNDTNIHRNVKPLEVATTLLGDANNFYGMANPAQIDTVEMGFVDGMQEPFIYVHSVETAEPTLLSGNVVMVIRYEFGGDILEPQAFVGSIVA